MKYIDVRTAADSWGIKERRVTALCRSGRVKGAIKEGKQWLIPEDTAKPVDGRFRTAKTKMISLKPLPIGISDFCSAVTDYYYVDKTLMIRDFLDSIPKVSLFTRPRRFGKTLNMEMLRVFFEKTDQDTSVYFHNKKIWDCGDKYIKHQGRYPVISLTFKDVKHHTWEESLENLSQIFVVEFDRHSELLSSEKCSQPEKNYFLKILQKNATEIELGNALKMLSLMLHKHYNIAPVIIIDEYDTPIHQGYLNGYYDKIILFMRNLFSGAFKDNIHLSYGFLTGILRIAKESIFSGLNNLKECSILDDRFSEYFGFTKEEVRELLSYYHHDDKYEEVSGWYDGYLFGATEIFNPWSIVNYIDNNCSPRPYWISTGSNDIIREIVKDSSPEIKEQLQRLMNRETVRTYVDSSVIYPEIKHNPSSIYSFLLMAGYLKITAKSSWNQGSAVNDVAIPNKEILGIYEKEILSAFFAELSQSTALEIRESLLEKDLPRFGELLQKFLVESISSFDYSGENFYHGLMLGISAVMNNLYKISSNRESGNGRYDIQLKPYDHTLPGILIELKVQRDALSEDNVEKSLIRLSETAFRQIQDKLYDTDMKTEGIKTFIKIGIAFYKKQVKIKYEADI